MKIIAKGMPYLIVRILLFLERVKDPKKGLYFFLYFIAQVTEQSYNKPMKGEKIRQSLSTETTNEKEHC